MAESANSKQIALIGVATVLLVAAGAIFLRPRPTPAVKGVYHYDLSANKLYVQGPDSQAPAESVPAAVFACGSCEDPTTHFVAYLTKESDEYRQVLASGESPTPQQMEAGRLVRKVDGQQWIPASSEAGISLMRSVQQRCPAGKQAAMCQP